MSAAWVPDPQASPSAPWNTTLLSQRDVAAQIPINYVTGPGVSITAACFAHDLYAYENSVTCLSNLLATGFRRVVVDLYWDQKRQVWSLCPAEIPFAPGVVTVTASSSSSVNSSSGSTSQSSTGSLSLSGSSSGSVQSTSSTAQKLARQTSRSSSAGSSTTDSSSQSSTATPTLNNSTSISATTTTVSVGPSMIADTLFDIGPYTCSPMVDITMITNVMLDFMQKTDDTVHARVAYLILNLHSAASVLEPTEPASTPNEDTLPDNSSQLGTLLLSNLTNYLFTPSILSAQRNNLNLSWFNGPHDIQPDADYYTSFSMGVDQVSSNGWPGESYIEYHNSRRLLASFGTIDPQMSGYDTSNDTATIFPSAALTNNTNITTSSTDPNPQGCFYNPTNLSLPASNNSWATSSNLPSLPLSALSDFSSLSPITALSNCGISPILNSTLSNTTADTNINPYQLFVYRSIWSWAPSQPSNLSSASQTTYSTATSDDLNAPRCAAMNTSAAAGGRWQVVLCSAKLPAACQAAVGAPYVWSVTRDTGDYVSRENACGANASFEVPHTALENAHLLAAARQFFAPSSSSAASSATSSSAAAAKTSSSTTADLVYLNLNALSVPACWVQGVHSQCPYVRTDTVDADDVVVPTVAAIVVLVIAALTLLVKCGGNRRSSRRKRKRRGEGGWDYEGVPS